MIKKFYISFIIFLSIFSIFFSTISDSKANVPDNNDDRLFFPINSRKFSSYYGYRDLNGKNNFHDGVDIPATPGTNIYACNNGVIINSNFLKGYGNCIIIQHDDGTKSLYGHLSENFIVSIQFFFLMERLLIHLILTLYKKVGLTFLILLKIYTL